MSFATFLMSNFFASVPAQNAHKTPRDLSVAQCGAQFPDRLFIGDAGAGLAVWRHLTP